MTKQEYLDKLITAAGDGTFPSVNEFGSCRYRGPNGKRCAVGILVPDERYYPALEGTSISYDEVWKIVAGLVEGLNLGEMRQIQIAHDEMAEEPWDPQTFIGRLRDLSCFKGCVFPRRTRRHV